jgi:hypothetical protein
MDRRIMRRLFLPLVCLIFLAFVSSTGARMNMMVVGGGAPACATDSVDQENDVGTNEYDISDTRANPGQSFQVSASGELSSISIYIGSVETEGSIEMRWGTSSDLTTYEDSKTESIVSGDALSFKKFTFATKGSVATSTTYYFGVKTASGSIDYRRDNAAGYANGIHYYDTAGTVWDMNASSGSIDLRFRIYLCD